jgi:hypothetical protein
MNLLSFEKKRKKKRAIVLSLNKGYIPFSEGEVPFELAVYIY